MAQSRVAATNPARDRWFESIFLQRRVNKLSVPLEMMLVEGSIRKARTDWPSGGIARRNAHPPPQQRGGDPGVSPMPGPVYQPINGSGGKPAASPSSPSKFTSAAVKAKTSTASA